MPKRAQRENDRVGSQILAAIVFKHSLSLYVFLARLKRNPLPAGVRMISKVPVDLEKIGKKDVDRQALRVAIIAELDAVSLYEQLAQSVDNQDVKKVLLDIAKEEKTHVGEFQALLLKIDREQAQELEKGRKEVEEITGK